MKIAILGGRFDPPHIGHFQLSRQVLESRRDIDKLIFVPAYKHPWREIIASPEDRIAMLKTSLPDRTEVWDIEIKHKTERTIDSLMLLKEKLLADLYWIVGSDILPEFHRWKDFDKLTKLATFLVFPRLGYPMPDKLPAGFEKIEAPRLKISDFSSTAIRDAIKKKEPISGLVTPGVEKYIMENNLYE